jgi:hypothetical protein
MESATDILNCGMNSVVHKNDVFPYPPGRRTRLSDAMGCILEAVVFAAFVDLVEFVICLNPARPN